MKAKPRIKRAQKNMPSFMPIMTDPFGSLRHPSPPERLQSSLREAINTPDRVKAFPCRLLQLLERR